MVRTRHSYEVSYIIPDTALMDKRERAIGIQLLLRRMNALPLQNGRNDATKVGDNACCSLKNSKTSSVEIRRLQTSHPVTTSP